MELVKTEMRKSKEWGLYKSKCPKCGGSGNYHGFNYVGACFTCNGLGKVTEWKRILTDKEKEYRERAKLKRQVDKKAKADLAIIEKQKADELFMSSTFFIIEEENTYDIKEEIKALGGKFSYELGWYFEEEKGDWKLLTVKATDIFENPRVYKHNVKSILKALRGEKPSKGYGEEGQEYTDKLVYKRKFEFESNFGYRTTISNGIVFNRGTDVFVWYTTRKIEFTEGKEYNLRFKVKKFNEYEGTQTIIKVLEEIKDVGSN